MKNVIFIFFVAVICFCSCESGPEVTSVIPIIYTSYGSEIAFKGTNPDAYLEFDENKRCPFNESESFRTYKPYRNAPINRGDLCARIGCGLSWSNHKNK